MVHVAECFTPLLFCFLLVIGESWGVGEVLGERKERKQTVVKAASRASGSEETGNERERERISLQVLVVD